MGLERGRCAEPGCGRFVRAGAAICGRHGAGGGHGDDGQEREGRSGAAEFRRRLAQGEYRGLFPPPLGEVLAQAAAERPLVDEIGALRVTLARLLAEEEDPSKLAAGVARIAGVAIQAARAQRQLGEDPADGLTAALAEILAELNEEARRERERGAGAAADPWDEETEWET